MKLFNGDALPKAEPSPPERRDVCSLALLFQVGHDSPEGFLGETGFGDHFLRQKLDPFPELFIGIIVAQGLEELSLPRKPLGNRLKDRSGAELEIQFGPVFVAV